MGNSRVKLRAVLNPFRRAPRWSADDAGEFSHSEVRAVHASLPEYAPTPLVRLPALAKRLGIGRLLVKDESARFGLKAFKALGATYALFRFMQSELGEGTTRAEDFYREAAQIPSGRYTFCTATDGNHGRGVAWAAARLRQKAVIFMPAGSASSRVEAVRREGAEVVIVEGNYDEAVRRCAESAARNNWQIISDTSWEGYEQIPRRIAAGYSTLFAEIDEALDPIEKIDLALLPSGVGALAAAGAWHFRGRHKDQRVKLVSVEPVEAACMLESISTPDGSEVVAHGKLDSIMAGLNCGTPSLTAWPVIRDCFDVFTAIDDDFCTQAMRNYRFPEPGDPTVVAGESGAATLAGLLALCGPDCPPAVHEALGLGPHTTVLLLNTEGATDPEAYQRITGADPTH